MTNDERAKLAEEAMEQAQVYASSWSLVGSRFDDGGMLELAQEEKANLRALVQRLAAPAPAASQVPMTEDEITDIWATASEDHDDSVCIHALARAIEAHHGILPNDCGEA